MRDGIEDLRRRQTSRLWYRRPLGLEPVAEEAESDETIAMSSDTALDPGTPVLGETAEDVALFAPEDEYAYFELDVAGMKLRSLNFNDPHVHRSLHASTGNNGQLAWRAYPADAPSLVLSATENLSTKLLGPVLNSGIRYRVVDCYNGVVAIEIERSGLPPMRGYCLAADLETVEQGARPKRSGRQVDWLRSVSERVSQSFGVIDIALSNAPSHD